MKLKEYLDAFCTMILQTKGQKVYNVDFVVVSSYSGKVWFKSWCHSTKRLKPEILDCEISQAKPKIGVRWNAEHVFPYLEIDIRSYEIETKK